MPNDRWTYDADPHVGLGLRSDDQRRHKDARLELAELLADGPASGLNPVEEPENEELWTALCATTCARAARSGSRARCRASGQASDFGIQDDGT